MSLLVLSYLPCLGLVALVLWPFISYLWDANGLRQFPSPCIWASLSPAWRILHNLRWKHYAAVDDAHRRLGSHVRISSNHVSVLAPEAAYDIYGHGAQMLKEAWYDAGAGAHRNLADARNPLEHQAKRKMLSHVFAAKTVTSFEPFLQESLRGFQKQIDKHIEAESTINMRRYINYFTIDLFGQLLFGRNLGCVERGDDLLMAETKDGRLYKAPFIQCLLDSTVITTLLAMAPSLLGITLPLVHHHSFKKAGRDWDNIMYHNIEQRFAETEPAGDIFQKLLTDNKGQSLNLSKGDIAAECAVMMNAGTETTTAAMTNTIFLLYTHPRALAKLREELDASFPGSNVPTYEAASRLTYLRACIEESLRVRPASSFGLPRVVPKGGRMVAGKFIAEGVTVSVPTYSLLRNEQVFENATEFVPERWMTDDQEKKQEMMRSHLPFSTGPRACIGRNISYFEQVVFIATIIKFYDGTVPENFRLDTEERFNSNAGDLPMVFRHRGQDFTTL